MNNTTALDLAYLNRMQPLLIELVPVVLDTSTRLLREWSIIQENIGNGHVWYLTMYGVHLQM